MIGIETLNDPQLRQEGEQARYYGISVGSLDRDQLLSLIGYLGREALISRKAVNEISAMQRAVRAA